MTPNDVAPTAPPSAQTFSSFPNNSNEVHIPISPCLAICPISLLRPRRYCWGRALRSSEHHLWSDIPDLGGGYMGLPLVVSTNNLRRDNLAVAKPNSLFIDIFLNLLETPRNQRINFNQPPLIHLQHLQRFPLCSLTTSPTRNNSFYSKFPISPGGRFNFD
jgi:hypothetical protein